MLNEMEFILIFHGLTILQKSFGFVKPLDNYGLPQQFDFDLGGYHFHYSSP